jgi:uncharacterized protein
LETWILIASVALAAGLVQGLTGLGYSLVLVLTLVTCDVDLMTATMLATITCLVCQATIIYRLRERFDWRMMWPVVVGAAVGVPVGVWLLSLYGRTEWLSRTFGGFVVAVSLWLLLAPARLHGRQRVAPGWGLGSGLLSGLAGGLFNTGGPPAAMYVYSRPVPLNMAKVCVQWLFCGMCLARIALSIPAGMLTGETAVRAVSVMPATLIGSLIGVKLAERIHPDWLRKAVYILLVIIGLKLALFPPVPPPPA